MTQGGAEFGPDGARHYAYLNTEDGMLVTIELLGCPKKANLPEETYREQKWE